MNKTIAVILSGLLMTVLFVLFAVIIILAEKYDINLFHIVAGWIAGGWIGKKTTKFYEWLLKKQ